MAIFFPYSIHFLTAFNVTPCFIAHLVPVSDELTPSLIPSTMSCVNLTPFIYINIDIDSYSIIAVLALLMLGFQ